MAVLADALGVLRLGQGPLAGSWDQTPPVVAITAPIGTTSSTNPTVTWTYTSSKAQGHYRVRLYTQDGTTVLYDTGIVAGAATSHVLTYSVSHGTTYMVGVSVSDSATWSAEDTDLFTAELSSVASYADVESVGSIYEIGINGVGYMLADHPEREMRYQRQVVALDPPRLATSETPFSQAIERYSLLGYSDFSGGAGVRLKLDDSPARTFWDSEGINPFERGEISLLPATGLSLANTYASALSVIASDTLYTLTNTNELKAQATPAAAATTFTVTAAGTVTDLTSDGEYWYVCDGANIFRNNAAADVAAWSTENASLIEWCTDRIFIASANVLTSLTAAGAVEAIRATLPTGTTIRSITSGDGYVWFAADRQDRSVVWAYQLGTTDAAFVAFELPAGQVARSIGFYQGNLMVRAREAKASGARAVIYRCATSDGKLIASRVLDIDDGTVDHSDGAWGGDDRFVAFGWREMTVGNRSGIGVVDLATGGWAKWLYAPADAGSGVVSSILSWRGLWVFTIVGYGVVYETTTPLTSGWLKTSHDDQSSTLQKVYDEIEAMFDPLPSGGTVAYEYSIDAGASYTSAGATVSGAGLKSASYSPQVTGATIGLKVTLGSSGTSGKVRTSVVRLHQLGLADEVIVLPINCADSVTGLNGQTIREQTGNGALRARTLSSLTQTQVRFQDIDWPTTRNTNTYEVIGSTIETAGVYDRQKNRRVDSTTAILTLRRSFR